MIGRDGGFTFLLSNLLIVATVGVSLLWQAGKVRRVARGTPAAIDPPDVLVVLGARLQGDAVSAEYAARLRRAANLVRGAGECIILIVGGRTGNASVSEAEQGRCYLVDAGVPAKCTLWKIAPPTLWRISAMPAPCCNAGAGNHWR
jgi:hypothetical protein